MQKIPRGKSENEPLATWLPVWQVLPFPATRGSHQDIGGIVRVKVDVIYFDFAKVFDKSTTAYN